MINILIFKKCENCFLLLSFSAKSFRYKVKNRFIHFILLNMFQTEVISQRIAGSQLMILIPMNCNNFLTASLIDFCEIFGKLLVSLKSLILAQL